MRFKSLVQSFECGMFRSSYTGCFSLCIQALFIVHASRVPRIVNKTRKRVNIHKLFIRRDKLILIAHRVVALLNRVSEPSFYSVYFAVTLHDINISFVLSHPNAYHMIVKWKSVMKVSRRQVKVSGRQFSCMKAFTIPCNCSGCWMGWVGGGWTYWEFSICYGIVLKSINQCLNWPTLSVLQNI